MATNFLSEETQAVLLLCSPLLAARQKTVAPLSQTEFNELERHVTQNGGHLAQLLDHQQGPELLAQLKGRIETEQVEALLGRGFLLSLALEKWSSQGLWVLSRGSEGYPERFLTRLKHLAPPLLYGCGERTGLNPGGVAIVGSRDIDAAAEDFTRRLAAQCAQEAMTVVSGGARGVDQIAMLAALQAGGKVTGVMADSLARSALSPQAREAIAEGRLTLVSPYDPEAGFNVGNAMNRNKLIYALADAAVAVSSGENEGGTWSGALEQLEKFQHIPIWVRAGEGVPEGNRKLMQRGAHAFPLQPWPEKLKSFLEQTAPREGTWETGDLFYQP